MINILQTEQDIRLAEQFIHNLITFKNRLDPAEGSKAIDFYLGYHEIDALKRVLRVGIGELSK